MIWSRQLSIHKHAQRGIPVARVRLRYLGGDKSGSSTEATRDQY